MPLDKFDNDVLSASGNAQDLVKQFYNVDISQNNANKRMTGIRMHLNHKQKMAGNERDLHGMEEIVTKADGSQTTQRMLLLSEEEKLNPTRIMELMGYDPVQWKLETCKTKRAYWDVSMKIDGTSEKHTNHAYMVTVTVKPTGAQIDSKFIKEVFANLQPPKLKEYRYQQGSCMLELPIMDVHFAKMAWREETGQDYDMKIAAIRFEHVVLNTLATVKQYGLAVEKIIFPIGQDFFHFDTLNNTTTAGTQMDSDTRWQKMYSTGVDLLIWAVEQLRSIAPVQCMYVSGNHDKMLSYFATKHLQAYFRNTESVTVDVTPTPRKYVKYGKCLIGYSHGKEEGKRIDGIMQVEEPQLWGDSLYREWHLGDLHHEEVKEENGIIFRRISAITGTDAWHNEKAYKGAVQKAVAYLWDAEQGCFTTINTIC